MNSQSLIKDWVLFPIAVCLLAIAVWFAGAGLYFLACYFLNPLNPVRVEYLMGMGLGFHYGGIVALIAGALAWSVRGRLSAKTQMVFRVVVGVIGGALALLWFAALGGFLISLLQGG